MLECEHREAAGLVVGRTVAPYSPLAEIAADGIMLRKRTPLPCRVVLSESVRHRRDVVGRARVERA
jgi:hypothetical protein